MVVLGDLRDGFFYGVVVVNALIGIVQEVRAKLVLDRAALLAAPESRVRRDGRVVEIPIEGVVLDDLLVLRPGDQIPADARVVDSTGLSLDESLLTGEADPVFKDEDATLLSGSHVVTGTDTRSSPRSAPTRTRASSPARSASTRWCTRSCGTRPTASWCTSPGSSGRSS